MLALNCLHATSSVNGYTHINSKILESTDTAEALSFEVELTISFVSPKWYVAQVNLDQLYGKN